MFSFFFSHHKLSTPPNHALPQKHSRLSLSPFYPMFGSRLEAAAASLPQGLHLNPDVLWALATQEGRGCSAAPVVGSVCKHPRWHGCIVSFPARCVVHCTCIMCAAQRVWCTWRSRPTVTVRCRRCRHAFPVPAALTALDVRDICCQDAWWVSGGCTGELGLGALAHGAAGGAWKAPGMGGGAGAGGVPDGAAAEGMGGGAGAGGVPDGAAAEGMGGGAGAVGFPAAWLDTTLWRWPDGFNSLLAARADFLDSSELPLRARLQALAAACEASLTSSLVVTERPASPGPGPGTGAGTRFVRFPDISDANPALQLFAVSLQQLGFHSHRVGPTFSLTCAEKPVYVEFLYVPKVLALEEKDVLDKHRGLGSRAAGSFARAAADMPPVTLSNLPQPGSMVAVGPGFCCVTHLTLHVSGGGAAAAPLGPLLLYTCPCAQENDLLRRSLDDCVSLIRAALNCGTLPLRDDILRALGVGVPGLFDYAVKDGPLCAPTICALFGALYRSARLVLFCQSAIYCHHAHPSHPAFPASPPPCFPAPLLFFFQARCNQCAGRV